MPKIDLKLDNNEIRKRLNNEVEVLSDIPNILQSLEKGNYVDELKDLLQETCDTEFKYLHNHVEQEIDPQENSEQYIQAMKDNIDVLKSNLKKSLRICVEDVWNEKTEKVLSDYKNPKMARYESSNGFHFYQHYYGQNYSSIEQDRLKELVEVKKRVMNRTGVKNESFNNGRRYSRSNDKSTYSCPEKKKTKQDYQHISGDFGQKIQQKNCKASQYQDNYDVEFSEQKKSKSKIEEKILEHQLQKQNSHKCGLYTNKKDSTQTQKKKANINLYRKGKGDNDQIHNLEKLLWEKKNTSPGPGAYQPKDCFNGIKPRIKFVENDIDDRPKVQVGNSPVKKKANIKKFG